MIGLLRGLISPSTGYTTVAVLDNDTLQPLFQSAHPMRIAVDNEKEVTRWEVETGEERNDHVIDRAIEISVDFVLASADDVAQFNEIQDTYADLKLVTIQTRMRSYENMLMQAVPHDESIEVGATVNARFIEWREITPEYGEANDGDFDAEEPQSQPTKEQGRVSSKEPQGETQARGSVLSRMGIL